MNYGDFIKLIEKANYFYFTEYVLFSQQYNKILGSTCGMIPENYLSFLEERVIELTSHPVYPLEIMNRFKTFIHFLLLNINDCEKQKQLNAIIEKLDAVVWQDSKEIYQIEYLSRYATIENSKNSAFVSVQCLWEDLQKDFINFNYLITGHSKNGMPSDFLFFLNRLLFDFPEIFKYKPMKKRILALLQKSSLEGKEDYIHLIKHQNKQFDLRGFHLGKVEEIYCLFLITKFFFSSQLEKDLETVPLCYFYSENFMNVLNDGVHNLLSKELLAKTIKKNLLDLLSFMRSHIKAFSLSNAGEIILNLNELIVEINMCQTVSTSMYELMEEYGERIGFSKFKKYYTEEEFSVLSPLLENHIRYTPQVMEYLFGKMSLETLFGVEEKQKEAQKIMPYILDYLYKSYPRLFFDPIISKNAKNLVSCLSSFERGEFMRKLNRIRKD